MFDVLDTLTTSFNLRKNKKDIPGVINDQRLYLIRECGNAFNEREFSRSLAYLLDKNK